MVLRKVFKLGNSKAVIIPPEYNIGDFVDIEVSQVEIRKINKQPPEITEINGISQYSPLSQLNQTFGVLPA